MFTFCRLPQNLDVVIFVGSMDPNEACFYVFNIEFGYTKMVCPLIFKSHACSYLWKCIDLQKYKINNKILGLLGPTLQSDPELRLYAPLLGSQTTGDWHI